MAISFTVSIPESEKELARWIAEKQSKKELSPSVVFRDAIRDLKKQDDILNSENPIELHRKIEIWQKLHESKLTFLEEKGLMNDFQKFEEQQKVRQDFAKKGIETIEIKGTKKELKEEGEK